MIANPAFVCVCVCVGGGLGSMSIIGLEAQFVL